MLVLIILNVENYFCGNCDIFYMIIYLFEIYIFFRNIINNFTCTFD